MNAVRSAKTLAAVGLGVLLQLGGVAQATPQSIVEGVWQTQTKSEITIAPCDVGLCGRITKIVVPPEIVEKYGDDLKAIGENYTDQMNKDPALRSRPIQDLHILTLKPSNNPWLFDGEIYNPQDGNIYSGYVEVIGADTIKLNGCVLYNLICTGEEWVRILTPPPAQ